MASVRWIDHLDEFGTFVFHSFLLVHRNLAAVPSMCRSRIAKTWLVQLDRSFVEHARTIESIKYDHVLGM